MMLEKTIQNYRILKRPNTRLTVNPAAGGQRGQPIYGPYRPLSDGVKKPPQTKASTNKAMVPNPPTAEGKKPFPAKPDFELEPVVLFGHTYQWRKYFNTKTLANHCRLSRPKLTDILNQLAQELAQHCAASGRVALALTVLFPQAPTAEASFAEALELREQLRRRVGRKPGNLFMGGVELHRSGPSPPSADPDRSIWAKDKDFRPAGCTTLQWVFNHRGEVAAVNRYRQENPLTGHGYLQLLLVLPPQGFSAVERFFHRRPDSPVTVVVRPVGPPVNNDRGQPEKLPPAVKPSAETLGQTLRYLLKEQALERQEQLFGQLARNRHNFGSSCAKYCGAYQEGGRFRLTQRLPALILLEKTLASFWLEPFGRTQPAFSDAIPPLASLLTSLLTMEDHYLLLYHRPPMVLARGECSFSVKTPWVVALAKPLLLPGYERILRIVATDSDRTFKQLKRSCAIQGWQELQTLLPHPTVLGSEVAKVVYALPPERVLKNARPYHPYAVWYGDFLRYGPQEQW